MGLKNPFRKRVHVNNRMSNVFAEGFITCEIMPLKQKKNTCLL